MGPDVITRIVNGGQDKACTSDDYFSPQPSLKSHGGNHQTALPIFEIDDPGTVTISPDSSLTLNCV